MLKITNKVLNRIKCLDFKMLKIITIDNVIKLDSFILYKCTLLLQALKDAIIKID